MAAINREILNQKLMQIFVPMIWTSAQLHQPLFGHFPLIWLFSIGERKEEDWSQ